MALDNYYALEPLLKARLQTIADDPTVKYRLLVAADLEGAKSLAQFADSIVLLPANDDRPEGEDGEFQFSGDQEVSQRWDVVTISRNVRDQQGGADARQDAGPVLIKVISALNNWKPSKDFSALKRVSGPSGGYADGVHVAPLRFETRFTTSGVKDA